MALTIGTIIHYELSRIPLILSADANFFPFADYTGKGRWNLRTDFAQDPSFEHDAVGMGGSIELQAQYRFASHWRTGMGWRGQWFEATDGTDTTFFSDGSKISIPLNKVVQQTMFFFFNLSYQW